MLQVNYFQSRKNESSLSPAKWNRHSFILFRSLFHSVNMEFYIGPQFGIVYIIVRCKWVHYKKNNIFHLILVECGEKWFSKKKKVSCGHIPCDKLQKWLNDSSIFYIIQTQTNHGFHSLVFSECGGSLTRRLFNLIFIFFFLSHVCVVPIYNLFRWDYKWM